MKTNKIENSMNFKKLFPWLFKEEPAKRLLRVHVVDGFYEYTDSDWNDEPIYHQPVRTEENQNLSIRLYCYEKGCKQFIKGVEGYNGIFTAETGQTADLRNECWYCNEHQPKKS
jgi:hypothetical protein